MIVMHWLVGLAIAQGAAPSNAPAQSPGPGPIATQAVEETKVVRSGEVDKAEAEAFIAGCAGRKFETSANSNNAGKLRKAKLVLCAKPGDTDEMWIATLEKAASSVVASTQLSIEAKAKISGDLQTEIARLRASE